MTLLRPIHGALRRPVYGPLAVGLPWEGARGGDRAPTPFDPAARASYRGAYLGRQTVGTSIPEYSGGAAGTLTATAALDATALDGLPGIVGLDAGTIELPISFAGSQAMTLFVLLFDRTKTAAYIISYGSGAQQLRDLFYNNNHTFTRANAVGTPIQAQSLEINGGTVYPIVVCYRSSSAKPGNDQYPVASYGFDPPTNYTGPTDNAGVFGAGPLTIGYTPSSAVFGGALAFAEDLDASTRDQATAWLVAQASTAFVPFQHMGDSITGGTYREQIQSMFNARPDGGKRFRAVGVYGTAPNRYWAESGATTLTLAANFDSLGMGANYFASNILLMIGANDIIQGASAATLAARMRTLLPDIGTRNVGPRIILSKNYPMSAGYAAFNATMTDYCDNHIESVASDMRALGWNVEVNGALRTAALAGAITFVDGLHLDAAGETAAAGVLYPFICGVVGLTP